MLAGCSMVSLSKQILTLYYVSEFTSNLALFIHSIAILITMEFEQPSIIKTLGFNDQRTLLGLMTSVPNSKIWNKQKDYFVSFLLRFTIQITTTCIHIYELGLSQIFSLYSGIGCIFFLLYSPSFCVVSFISFFYHAYYS